MTDSIIIGSSEIERSASGAIQVDDNTYAQILALSNLRVRSI